MKRIHQNYRVILSTIFALSLVFGNLISCKNNSTPDDEKKEDNNQSEDTNQDEKDSDSSDDAEDSSSVIIIDGSKIDSTWALATITLKDFSNKKINVTLDTKMKVESSANGSSNLMWQINANKDSSYPIIASKTFEKGTTDFTSIKESKKDIACGTNPVFYLSNYGLKNSDFKIYLKDFKLTVSDGNTTKDYTIFDSSAGISTEGSKDDSSSDPSDSSDSDDSDSTDTTPRNQDNWLSDDVPSIYETYKDSFDYIGIAAEYGNFGLSTPANKYTGTYTHSGWGEPNELYYEEVQNGIAKHANSITLGNEMKPQFLLQWWDGKTNNTLIDYTASNGQTIKVPEKLNGENLIYATLNVAKKMGVKMRGHVLTWHSQTPDGFFAENYTPEYNGSNPDLISNMVSKEVMTARHEWYIKTVLKCVADWEAANGYGTGNHIIWAWDVVNEAMADDAGKTYTGDNQNWLRGSTAKTKDQKPSAEPQGSRWYQLYGNEEFIINAFRFANAYAPSDVKLCYNDYNEYMDYDGGYKTSAICHIVELIKTGNSITINGRSVSPRIDVIAMQSHVGINWPGVTGYENALKRFLELADVHVSEIDFAAENTTDAAKAYSDYFKMLQKYGKKSTGAHKVRNITIWGVNDENSWINPSSSGNHIYPLLFNLVDNTATSFRKIDDSYITYPSGDKIPLYDIGDTYKTNDSFWAVIDAHVN